MPDPDVRVKITAVNETERPLNDARKSLRDLGDETEKLTKDARDLGREEERLVNRVRDTEGAMKLQKGVTREKGETTEDLRKRVQALGMSEEQARRVINDTTQSIKLQKDGTVQTKEVVGDLTRTMEHHADGTTKVTSATRDATDKTKGLGDVAKTAIGVGVGIVATEAVQMFTQALRESITVGLESETTFNRYAAVHALSAEETQNLKDAIRQATETAGAGRTSFLEASEAVGALAFESMTSAETVQILSAAMDLSALTGRSLRDEVKDLDDVLDAWTLTTGDAADVANLFFTVARATETEIPDLTQAMAEHGVVLRDVGFSLEEATALYGGLMNAGVEGAGAILKAYGQLGDESNGLRQDLEALGIQVVDNNGRLRDLPDILRDVEASGADSRDILEAFGIKGSAAFRAIVEQGPTITKALEEVRGGTDNLRQAVVRLEDDNTQKIERLKKGWEDAKVGVGVALVDLYDKTVQAKDATQDYFENIDRGVDEGFGSYLQAIVGVRIETDEMRRAHEELNAVVVEGFDLLAEETASMVLVRREAEVLGPALDAAAGATADLHAEATGTAASLDHYRFTAGEARHETNELASDSYDLRRALSDLGDQEQRLSVHVLSTKNAMALQQGVTKEKGETTASLRRRVEELGLTEDQARKIITDTTESIKAQKDGTVQVTDAITGATKTYRLLKDGAVELADTTTNLRRTFIDLGGSVDAAKVVITETTGAVRKHKDGTVEVVDAVTGAVRVFKEKGGVLRELKEDVNSFRDRLRDLGVAEKDVTALITESTKALRQNKDGTVEITNATTGATTIYRLFNGELVAVGDKLAIQRERMEKLGVAYDIVEREVRSVNEALEVHEDGTIEITDRITGATRVYEVLDGTLKQVGERIDNVSERTKQYAANAEIAKQKTDLWREAQAVLDSIMPDSRLGHGGGFHTLEAGNSYLAMLANGNFDVFDKKTGQVLARNANREQAAALSGIGVQDFETQIVQQLTNILRYGNTRPPPPAGTPPPAGDPYTPPPEYPKTVMSGNLDDGRPWSIQAVDPSGTAKGTGAFDFHTPGPPSNFANTLATFVGGRTALEWRDVLKGSFEYMGLPFFARGAVVSGGPLPAIIGDNPSRKEFILPFERNDEFADAIARRLGGAGGGVVNSYNTVTVHVQDARGLDDLLREYGVKRRMI